MPMGASEAQPVSNSRPLTKGPKLLNAMEAARLALVIVLNIWCQP
jgi:hypothetical protein